MVTCNTTLEDLGINETHLVGSLTFHDIGLIVSAVCGLISIVISFYLIFKHGTHYSKPVEQRHIIRILFMIPIYSTVSFLSYYFFLHTIYYQVLRDCYEAFAIASFFTLLCTYLEPNLHDQKEYFRKTDPKNWVLPLNWFQRCTGGQNKGLFRKPRSGLTLFNILWLCVFQYCFIRVLFTIVSVITEANGRYCEASLNPVFAHVWVLTFEAVSVTIAMYGLIQFYIQLKNDIAEHKPFLKILCIKLVIFFSFWQTELISFLSSSGAISVTDHIGYQDIIVGIPAMLLCMEMMIFAVMHLFAFPWREYATSRPDSSTGFVAKNPPYLGGPGGWRAYADAWNPWDIVKATARGIRWLFVGRRTREQDVSYQRNNSGGANSTNLQPLQSAGAFTPESTSGAFVEPPSYTSQPNPFANPGAPPYPDTGTSYRPSQMPSGGPKAFDAGALADRHNYNTSNRPYLETSPYPPSRSISGQHTPAEYAEFDHDEEDRAALLRNAAAQGTAGRGGGGGGGHGPWS